MVRRTPKIVKTNMEGKDSINYQEGFGSDLSEGLYDSIRETIKYFKLRLRNIVKNILIGREFSLIDRLIFHVSNGYSSGWVVGNKLRNFFYGKKKYVSEESLIIIGGYPRSGTTLLQSLLEQHPDIVTTENEVSVLQDIRDISILKRETSGLNRKGFLFSDEEIKELDLGGDLICDGEKIILKYKNKKNAKIVLLKQPKNVLFIKEIFKFYPNAKFIHMIRDGRDATMSQRFFCLASNKKEHPYDWCCRQWTTFIKRGIAFRKDSRYAEVYYEKLLKNTIDEVNRIFDFAGLKRMDRITYKEDSNKKYPHHPNVGNPIDLGRIGNGSKKMSTCDKIIFSTICGDIYKKLGYAI